jgi:hypothetical protein
VSSAGYSGKPLIEKLGLKSEMRAIVINQPPSYTELLGGTHSFVTDERGIEFVHLFTESRTELDSQLAYWRHRIKSDGIFWVSWPKKSSKVPTDVDENVIREICLPMGWVDVKVCAVSEIWSGLKLVVRKELRT